MRAHGPTGDDNSHDPGLADYAPVLVAAEDSLHQPGLEVVELATGIAQPSHLDDRAQTEVQERAPRQAVEIDIPSGDVLPHLPRRDIEAATAEFVMQLDMDQVYLTQVRLSRVDRYTRAMLDARPGVGITVDPMAGDEVDAVFDRLAEVVHTATADRDHFATVSELIHPHILAGQCLGADGQPKNRGGSVHRNGVPPSRLGKLTAIPR